MRHLARSSITLGTGSYELVVAVSGRVITETVRHQALFGPTESVSSLLMLMLLPNPNALFHESEVRCSSDLTPAMRLVTML